MSDTGTTGWTEPYEKAVNEPGKEKLRELVHEAEAAIYERLQQLQNSADPCQELGAIREATKRLLSLKVTRLGWPPIE
jgi:hypothetical protein